MQRLPESLQTLYAELLEQELAAELERRTRGLPPGSFVSKEIKGRKYWYWQLVQGASKVQRYVGPDSPELRKTIASAERARAELAPDQEQRARLAGMLLHGGLLREPATIASVLALMADLGFFQRGGVLVGTQAYRTMGGLLGVRLSDETLRTQDVDLAQDLAIAFDLAGEPRVEVAEALLGSGQGFLPVPDLDPRSPSASFKVRGRDLRVDFLVPAGSRRSLRPVALPGLGVSAKPLAFLEYLIESPTPALVLGPSRAVLVRIPDPARFALHKLWTAGQRPVAETAKRRKDLRQASALVEALIADRPEDLRRAAAALRRRE